MVPASNITRTWWRIQAEEQKQKRMNWFFQQFSLQWNFFLSMLKIYRKNTFTRISYKKTKQKGNFGKLVWSLSYYMKYPAEYYVPLKKSGCALSPEGRLGNLSPRHCQQTVFLARSRLDFPFFAKISHYSFNWNFLRLNFYVFIFFNCLLTFNCNTMTLQLVMKTEKNLK